MIKFEKCHKLFGGSLALNNINVEISGKGLLLLLGGNGAGKSTFLRACAGLISPSLGNVKCEMPVAFMGHLAMLYPQLSVKENLDFFSAMEVAEADDSERNYDWLDLKSLENKAVCELSQGQRARVALARVLQSSPIDAALLLDEPGAAFDQNWQKKLLLKLKELASQRLVIMVTHDPERYLEFASRVIILSQGSVAHDFIFDQSSAGLDRSQVLQAYSEVLR